MVGVCVCPTVSVGDTVPVVVPEGVPCAERVEVLLPDSDATAVEVREDVRDRVEDPETVLE